MSDLPKRLTSECRVTGGDGATAGCVIVDGSRKIQTKHLDRLAVVYVRQSTAKQVLENRESTALQYGLAQRAKAYGWPEDRVLIIDDDLGQSGRTAENRLGFQRLLAEVGLDHVGLVLGIEMSRLARSCKDWYQLLELCAVFNALLADQDGLYDPSDYNDRLLLGLKGTMSEAELHILKNRMHLGLRNKALRGELLTRLPPGFVFDSEGEVKLDPDEQTRSLIEMIFDKFDELGTGRGVSQYLRRHHIRLPFIGYTKPNKGQVEWREPSVATLYAILRHPNYAGAYVYGRRQMDLRRKALGQPASGRISRSPDEWLVLLKDRLPAYISWDRFLANQQRLSDNCSQPNTPGVPRGGPTLCSGLVRCGRCGWRMRVLYHAYSNHPTYHCHSQETDGDYTQCQNIAAGVVDELISRQVLQAVEPAALALSLQAAEDIERERQRVQRHAQQELERSQYRAQRAKRQYDAVDPENRLVARELESQWELSIRDQRRAQEQLDRLRVDLPEKLSAEERQQIERLAHDLPTLWNDPNVTPEDRQVVIRALIELVVINVQGRSEFTDITIHWAGGFQSHHEIRRPVGQYTQLRDYDRLKQRITDLRLAGKSKREIAEHLNREGFYPPRQAHQFSEIIVGAILIRIGLVGERVDSVANAHLLQANEYWMRDLAHELNIPQPRLSSWCRRRWIRARKVTITRARWIIWADEDEKRRLRNLYRARRLGPTRHYTPELTCPKTKPDNNPIKEAPSHEAKARTKPNKKG